VSALGGDPDSRPPFERLHPAVQHHVVNTLGWRVLRPHQEQAIAPILRGEHVLVQAPTAGGKTESAILPLLSRMLEERWGQPSVLYLCPIKALLNNLEARLTQLAGMVGGTVGVWHGDVGQGARKRILRERPDVLLATPESVEVMLVSRAVEHRSFFANLRAVVVDEVHAFAGDDRGWHLLALIERVCALAREPVQRIALSATLSNPEQLVTWLAAGRDEPRTVVRGMTAAPVEAEVQIDWVGSLENAALVVSRIHRGEKRLVFCDSRRQVEELGQLLRGHGVRTFVSHSSLGIDERRQAEEAFAQGSDCVIVATSTLELGLDVGDLDRVIQIDAPSTVAGFLQRLGRTGRRSGTRRNCLFLTTETDALLRACGLMRLWTSGFVEPVEPPLLPYPVLAQQVLALLLQEDGGTDRATLDTRLERWQRTAGVSREDFGALVDGMLERDVLFADGPILGISVEGERRYGAKHFLELFSVFNTPPLVTVYHGLREVGQVHPMTFRRRKDEPVLLTLGGHGWRVTHLDPERKRAWVEPADAGGKSRWLGVGPPMHYALAQAALGVLREGLSDTLLSRRAADALADLRDEFAWAHADASTLVVDPGRDRCRWWSFAGDRYNQAVVERIRVPGLRVSSDGLGLTIHRGSAAEGLVVALRDAIRAAQVAIADGEPPAAANAPIDEMIDALKFAESVPRPLLSRLSRARFHPAAEALVMRDRPIDVRFVS
jgi:ATP-dependent Lhr-like helicase